MNKIILLVCLLLASGMVMADTATVEERGRELYLSYGCALCHGNNGNGRGINSQRFNPPPTNFHDPQSFHHGLDRDSIRHSIQYGIKEDNSIMPAFEDIPPEELDQIVRYLQSLQKKD